jgi:cytoskeletal protein CcmA (bactofilin family)
LDTATVIGEGVRIDGTVGGSGSLTVAGRVRGAVRIEGTVDVTPTGQVEASLEARDVTIAGTVRGPVSGRAGVVLTASALVEGDVAAPRVEIAPEARLRGRLNMTLDLPRGLGAAAGRDSSRR